MLSNRLKVNTDETQFIWLGTRQQFAKINCPTLTLAGNIINQSDDVTVLGVLFDLEMTFRTHIKRLAGKCFYQLRQLRVVRGALTLDASKAVVHAFVSSRVDYCNSIFSLVRVKHCTLFSQFWTPTPVSSQDEGSMTTSLTSSGTNYTGFLSPKGLNTSCAYWSTNVFTSWRRSTLSRCAKSSRNFQAAGIYVLLLMTFSSNWEWRHRHTGRAVFAVCGQRTWNKLPSNLRDHSLSVGQFSSVLKTELFLRAY